MNVGMLCTTYKAVAYSLRNIGFLMNGSYDVIIMNPQNTTLPSEFIFNPVGSREYAVH